ncbi:hypothetical protein AAFF_G00015010 [Aldrovandia affinis]|uniref:C2 domain-containing protein n=1 Tax=Aldrovandia affinis TaxID=143900 RepID=A0AAD7S6F2_9TELE|nr:hypothetical protein AAFF_G00015010 [Aldrovandia affinis]
MHTPVPDSGGIPANRGGQKQQHRKSAAWQRDMNFPSSLELSIGDIRIPFSDDIKYSILGISILLFLVAMIVLVWQTYRYCTERPRSQELMSGLLCTEDKAIPSPHDQERNFKMQKLNVESCKLGSPGSEAGGSGREWSPEQEERPEDQVQVRGSLRFSLFHDEQEARLVVTILEARDLPVRSSSQSVDPVVKGRLLWAGPKDAPGSARLHCVLQEWQSRAVKDSANPAFGDQFTWPLADGDVSRLTVRLEVRDFDKYSRQGILGEVRAALDGLDIAYPLEIQQDLRPPKKDLVGEVLLSLKYLPTAQRVDVGILKIRTLSQSSNKNKALYARTSVVCNRCKLRHQKTTIKTRWEVTVFNEVMTFALPDPQVADCSVAVSVYEVGVGKKSSKRLIGQLSLGKGKGAEDEHWSLMMRSLRQPIAKWHLLFI